LFERWELNPGPERGFVAKLCSGMTGDGFMFIGLPVEPGLMRELGGV
jgi:hypothetical protein